MGNRSKIKLPLSFYLREDVAGIAQDLLGKYLFTSHEGHLTGGMIIETEAYGGISDRACHAYKGRYTERTKTLYEQGGIAYVYFCYGMHHLLNAVTNKKGTPEAVLIRAIKPEVGIDIMLKRRNKDKLNGSLTMGPGSVCQALHITRESNGLSLSGKNIWIEDRGISISKNQITALPRIGVDYAKEDAKRPWRFTLNLLA